MSAVHSSETSYELLKGSIFQVNVHLIFTGDGQERTDRMIFTLLFMALTTLLASYFWRRRKIRTLLPAAGPPGWPLIGNVLDMNPSQPHTTVMEWAKQYGEVYTINLMGTYVVVLTSEEAIHVRNILRTYTLIN